MSTKPTTQDVAKEIVKVFKVLKEGTQIVGDEQCLYIARDVVEKALHPVHTGMGQFSGPPVELHGKSNEQS